MACVISVYSALLFALLRFVPCPNVYVSHRFVYDAQRQSIFSLSPLPSALARLASLTLTLWHILFWNYIFGHFVETVSCSALGLALAAAPGHPACDSSCSVPPHHFLLTKNSLLGNFSLFILFATLQKCLCPGQSMPQMHSIVPAPLWPRPLPVAVANRLPLTVRIPCVFIELRNVFYALWKH